MTTFNKETIQRILSLLENEDSPHMLIYGKEGSGKNYIVNLICTHHPNKIVVDVESIKDNTNFFNIIHQLINSPNTLNMYVQGYKATYKALIIINAHLLNNNCQMYLRRIIEKSSNRFRFIMISNDINCIIDPLRSRCACFRIKSPNNKELYELFDSIKPNNFSEYQKQKIIDYAENNISRFLLLAAITAQSNIPEIEKPGKSIVELLCKKHFFAKNELFKELQSMLQQFTYNEILRDIILEFINKNRLTVNIVDIVSKIENNIKMINTFPLANNSTINNYSFTTFEIVIMSGFYELWLELKKANKK